MDTTETSNSQRPAERGSMADTSLKSETQIGKLLVDRKLMTNEELVSAQEEQKRLTSEGKLLGLTEVMLKLGYITRNQLQRLTLDNEDSLAQKMQQIPGYQIMDRLGAGAMATVFKARQLALDRIVAVKVLPKRLGADPEFVKRFDNEGKRAARLSHNNIVQAIDAGVAGGYCYFVMEYIEGRTVYDDLAPPHNKIYSEKEALKIIIQVALALEHASTKGLVHRDVKPKNIMLTKQNVAKLADMGLARETADSEAAKLEAGRAFGTPYYISPEQIRGEINIDFRADMYSLGATFYHLVTGRVPFEGPTPATVMNKHLKEPLTPPDHINPSLSAGVGEVIERMMKKRPTDRYESWGDLLADLEALARGEPPTQARKQLDIQLLSDMAKKGDAVPAPVVEPEEDSGQVPILWVFILGALLCLSIILNIIQLLT